MKKIASVFSAILLIISINICPLFNIFTLSYADENIILTGDADKDGIITPKDARLILRAARGIELIEDKNTFDIFDIETDGRITFQDALLLLQKCTETERPEIKDETATANTPDIIAEYSVNGEYLIVSLFLNNAVGTNAFEFNLNYDGTVLKFDKYEQTDYECKKNSNDETISLTTSYNSVDARNLRVAGFFFKELYSSEYYKYIGENINGENYNFSTVTFKITDNTKTDTSLIFSNYIDGQYSKGIKHTCNITLKKESENPCEKGHSLTKTAEVAATCITKGNNEYYYCSVCKKYFKEETGTTETTIVAETLAELGHDWATGVVTTPATCTTKGVKTYTCKRIGCKTVRTEAINATGHKIMIKTPAKAATYTETGNNEYYTCATCKHIFKDAKGTIPTTITNETIAKKKQSFSLGDIDKDNNITAADARLALRASVLLENYAVGSTEFSACDVDKDGKITAADARLILRAAVGLQKLN